MGVRAAVGRSGCRGTSILELERMVSATPLRVARTPRPMYSGKVDASCVVTEREIQFTVITYVLRDRQPWRHEQAMSDDTRPFAGSPVEVAGLEVEGDFNR